jgi:HPt (histidine-containing phosphotransfer) domain-containing protein
MTWKPTAQGDEREDAMETMSEQVVDERVIRRMRMQLGDAGLEALARLFVEQTPRLVNQLREAVNRGDPTTARYTAHSLKGTSSSLGAVGLATLCCRLEEDDLFDGEVVKRLEDTFETTREQFFEHLSRARRF